MTGEELVTRFAKARQNGRGKWMACCPAHNDKSPSLSIAEAPDGRILIHCFAGCAANEVLEAVGLEMTDLFPDSLGTFPPVNESMRPKMSPGDAMRALIKEALCVGIIAANMNDFGEISDEDRALLVRCIARMDMIFTTTGLQR
jgi:hypothetical protein